MPAEDRPVPAEPIEPDEATKRARRERAARLMGDLLPRTTSDETPEGWGDERGGTSHDDELRRNVPPHHGRD